MTQFLDVRLAPVGGELASQVALNQGTSLADYAGIQLDDLKAHIRGQHVLIAAHGFNVDRQAGIADLSNWEGLLQLPQSSAFVGVLWPGDSVWAHGLDYPDEPKVANNAGLLLAPFIDANFGGAASVSFASHSLGARLILQTINNMSTPVRRVVIMAGAIDDDTLNTEFQAAAAKVGVINVLSSKEDAVLSALFPLGNWIAGFIAAGHPWWRAALGHTGPVTPLPANFKGPFEIPDKWNFQHGDYLRIDDPLLASALPLPIDIPPQKAPVLPPDNVDPSILDVPGWREEFSSAFASTRFR
jgi:Alpha/beta hydrolase of unknown function (DUF900)